MAESKKQLLKIMLVDMLSAFIDKRMIASSFKRTAKSTDYKRDIFRGKQSVMLGTRLPRQYDAQYLAAVEIRIGIEFPSIREALQEVLKVSLERNPVIEFNAGLLLPEHSYKEWRLTHEGNFLEIGNEIEEFIQLWVLPCVEKFTTVEEICAARDSYKELSWTGSDWTMIFIGAYLSQKQYDKAYKVLEEDFGSPRSRRINKELFDSLEEILGKK